MKRLLPLLLSAVLLVSVLCVGSVAVTLCADAAPVVTTDGDTDPAFVVDSTSAMAGETVQVALRVKNNPGIVALRVNVTYDAAVLTPTAMTEQDFADVSFGPLTKNPLTVLWADAIHPDVTTDGVIALFTFAVAADAPVGEIPLLVGITDPEDIFNAAGDTVSFAMVHGGVNVVDYIPGDVNNDGKVNVRDLGLMQQYLNGWDVTMSLTAADVNGDGKVNVRDLGTLQQYLNGWDVTLQYGTATETTTAPTVTTTEVPTTQTTVATPSDGPVTAMTSTMFPRS